MDSEILFVFVVRCVVRNHAILGSGANILSSKRGEVEAYCGAFEGILWLGTGVGVVLR